jgi:hypothetical protein
MMQQVVGSLYKQGSDERKYGEGDQLSVEDAKDGEDDQL